MQPELESAPRKEPASISIRILIFLILVAVLTLVANLKGLGAIWQQGDPKLNGCLRNLRDIASALNRYSSTHEGQLPDHLDLLVKEGYLSEIPICPGAGKDTYSRAYFRELPGQLRFWVNCHGAHHESGGQSPNYPAVNDQEGTVTKSLW